MTPKIVHQAIVALTVIVGAALFTLGGAGAVGVGKTCGGLIGTPCDAGLWCDPQAGRCGVVDVQGKCVKVPDICTEQEARVCGCDKKTYGNDCKRRAAKVAKAANGACK